MMTGGELLVACLKAQGVERVFSVPGESYLAVLDGLYGSGIDNVVARQEGGAAMMAEADGKMTGRPGVAMVTRGPGATNAAAGVHIAKQDSTPMVLFVGQIGRAMRGREAFQEVDYRAMFSDLAKWVEEIDDVDRIPEILSHAWHVAMSGRPGPVVLALPEDMLREATAASAGPRVEVASPAPSRQDVARFGEVFSAADNPLLILGGSRWTQADSDACAAFAMRHGLPVACTFRRQHLMDHTQPAYIGDIGFNPAPHLKKRMDDADLVILLGCRFSEVPSQSFTQLDIPAPRQTLVHIHPGPEEIGRIYRPTLGINATPAAFLDAVSGIPVRDRPAPDADHAAFLAHSTPRPEKRNGVDNSHVLDVLRREAAKDAIVTNGAGNYAIWLHRYWVHQGYATYLGPTSGSMGYGLPAAVAAKERYPERQVLCFAGDGCFQMTSQEFGTLTQRGLAVVVLLFDNRSYGTIRMHQEKRYPERVSGTKIVNPDFAAIARAYGGYGETVAVSEDFEAAFARAVASGKPALLHLLTDPDIIAPMTSIADLKPETK